MQQKSSAPQHFRLAPAFVAPYCLLMQPIKLGQCSIDRPVLLAPMAGVTDPPFRAQAQKFGAAYTVSEMVASEQLAFSRPDMVRRAAGGGRLTPLAIQIAGREASWMAMGAKLAEDAGANVIDINMGCPCKRVTSGLSGSALMQDPDGALRLIEAVVGATRLPVTLKMRLGWDASLLTAPEIARRAEAAGVAMIVVHGRTRSQFYEGAADWSAIAHTVQAVRIPVIANGDITDVASARRALRLSGAAGVMIGRGAYGAPWAPAQIATGLLTGVTPPPPSSAVVRDALLELYEDCLNFYGAALGARIARKHIAWTIDAAVEMGSVEDRKRLRGEICRLENPADVKAHIAALDLAPMRRAA